jgi:hypothetical protein
VSGCRESESIIPDKWTGFEGSALTIIRCVVRSKLSSDLVFKDSVLLLSLFGFFQVEFSNGIFQSPDHTIDICGILFFFQALEEKLVFRSILEGYQASQPRLGELTHSVLFFEDSAVELLNKAVFRASDGSTSLMLVELVKGSIGFSNSQSSLNTLQCLRISFEVFCVSNDSHATEFNVFARSNSGVFIIGIVKVFPLHTPISSFIDYHISDQGSALEGTKACRLTHEMVVTLSSRSDTKSLLVRIFAFIVNVF